MQQHTEACLLSVPQPPAPFLCLLPRVIPFPHNLSPSWLLSLSWPQDRLIYLDAAEDFVAKARRFYPKRDDDDEEDEETAINLPMLLARVNRAMNGGGEDDERLDEEDGSGREEEDKP